MHPDLRVGRCVRRSRLRISYRRRQILAPSTLYRPLRYTISCITSSFHCGNSICAAPMLCLAALRTKRISLRAGGYGSKRHDPQRGLGVCATGERSMAGGWQAGRIAKVGSDRKSGANHQRLATTSREDDCHRAIAYGRGWSERSRRTNLSAFACGGWSYRATRSAGR